MRQPRPADVIEAVVYVSGGDLFGKRSDRARWASLATQCLVEICDLNMAEVGRQLHMDRSTARYHYSKPPDYDTIAMVIQRVSDQLDEEDLSEAKRRTEREMAREMMA